MISFQNITLLAFTKKMTRKLLCGGGCWAANGRGPCVGQRLNVAWVRGVRAHAACTIVRARLMRSWGLGRGSCARPSGGVGALCGRWGWGDCWGGSRAACWAEAGGGVCGQAGRGGGSMKIGWVSEKGGGNLWVVSFYFLLLFIYFCSNSSATHKSKWMHNKITHQTKLYIYML